MKKRTKLAGGLRYNGGGGSHSDVPMRDLTPAEVEQHGRAWLLSLQCPNADRAMYAEIEIEKIEEE